MDRNVLAIANRIETFRTIENSGLKKEDIDLIIASTVTPYQFAHSKRLFQHKIQAYKSVYFGISVVLVSISKGKVEKGLEHKGVNN